jgi:DNA-binding CsgD family transcriptional regulator
VPPRPTRATPRCGPAAAAPWPGRRWPPTPASNARAELRRAAAELEARGAWGYRDDAVRVLRRLGDRPRPAIRGAPGQPDGHGRLSDLTPREREVAALVADGQTNAQIALRLRVSQSTVEKHVSRVLAKPGLSSRAGVVRLLAHQRAPLP